MSGLSTAGRNAMGVVCAVIPGVGFLVDSGIQRSFLWRDFRLETERSAAEFDLDASSLRRMDSGIDYGYWGRPDCEFWESHGVEPLFLVEPAVYSPLQKSVGPAALRQALEAVEVGELSRVELRALKRQLGRVRAMEYVVSQEAMEGVCQSSLSPTPRPDFLEPLSPCSSRSSPPLVQHQLHSPYSDIPSRPCGPLERQTALGVPEPEPEPSPVLEIRNPMTVWAGAGVAFVLAYLWLVAMLLCERGRCGWLV